MTCPKCGADAVADAVFCSKCGARLNAEAAVHAVGGGRSSGPAVVSDSPEETLWEGRFSPKAMISVWIGMGLIDALMIATAIYLLIIKNAYWWVPLMLMTIIDLVIIVRYLIKRISIRYRLSNHRFFHEEGILNRTVNPIDLITITDVAFEQGIVERMMGVGRIKIMSSDTSDPILWVEGIEDVQMVATMIDKTRREEMMRRRVFYDASPHA